MLIVGRGVLRFRLGLRVCVISGDGGGICICIYIGRGTGIGRPVHLVCIACGHLGCGFLIEWVDTAFGELDVAVASAIDGVEVNEKLNVWHGVCHGRARSVGVFVGGFLSWSSADDLNHAGEVKGIGRSESGIDAQHHGIGQAGGHTHSERQAHKGVAADRIEVLGFEVDEDLFG